MLLMRVVREGHAKRMDESRFVIRIYESECSGRRRMERSKRRWMDNR